MVGPLRARSFIFFVATSTVTAIGSGLTNLLLVHLIGISSRVTILTYAQGALILTLPPILFSPVFGVLIDRWDKRRVFILTRIVQAGLFVVATALARSVPSLLPLWIVLFLFFTADVFNNSTAPALLPFMVRTEEIVQANSVWLTFVRIASVAGMFLGGHLVAWIGLSRFLAIDGLLFLIAGLLALGVVPGPEFRLERGPATAGAFSTGLRRFLKQLGAVIREIRVNRYVLFVVASIIVCYAIFGIAYSALTYLVQKHLGLETAGVSNFRALIALGMILGTISIGLLGRRWSKTRIIVFGIAVIAGLFIAGSALIKVWYMILVAVLTGLVFAWVLIAQTTILQTRVPAEMEGRIFATREFFNNSTLLITTLIVGLVGLAVSFSALLLIIGLALLAVAALGYGFVHGLETEKGTSPCP